MVIIKEKLNVAMKMKIIVGGRKEVLYAEINIYKQILNIS